MHLFHNKFSGRILLILPQLNISFQFFYSNCLQLSLRLWLFYSLIGERQRLFLFILLISLHLYFLSILARKFA